MRIRIAIPFLLLPGTALAQFYAPPSLCFVSSSASGVSSIVCPVAPRRAGSQCFCTLANGKKVSGSVSPPLPRKVG